MTVTIPDDTVALLIAGDDSRTPLKTLWIQNHSVTVGFWLRAVVGNSQAVDDVVVGEDLYLAPAQTVDALTVPSSILTDNPGLVSAKWLARQDSGGDADLNVGRM